MSLPAAAPTSVSATPVIGLVLPICESCEASAATVTVTFRDDNFVVCTACMPQDLITLETKEHPDGR